MTQNVQIRFADETVLLMELNQHYIYGGLMEGAPTREHNARTVARVMRDDPGARLIPPVETPVPSRDAFASFGGGRAFLPPIACVAKFEKLRGLRGLHEGDVRVVAGPVGNAHRRLDPRGR